MAVTLEQFVAALADTGIMASAEVKAFLAALPESRRPKDAQALARELFHSGKLTRYQAAAIYQGKAAGLTFGEYLVLDKLGAGGMGQVFKAQHRRMKRVVALKVLPPQATRSASAVRRFYREVEMAGKLIHPNIITAYDANEAGGLHYLAMEYVDGQDLAAMVQQQGPLSADTAIDLILQAARGLEFAHSLAIIHRDIKPSNLLVDREGTLKILDMGLARVSEGADLAAAEGLTQQGDVVGTTEYMAPEQALDARHATPQSDIYSLGCTLYRLLTGEPMYPTKKTPIEQVLAHRSEPIPALRARRPEIPAEVEAVYARMVAKQPAQRYATMTELATALIALGAGSAAKKTTARAASTAGPQDAEFSNFLKNLSVAGPAGAFKPPAAGEAAPSTAAGRHVRHSTVPGGGPQAPARRKVLIGAGLGIAAVALLGLAALLLSGGHPPRTSAGVDGDRGASPRASAGAPPAATRGDAASRPASPPPAAPPPLPVLAARGSTPPPLKEAIDLLKLVDPRRDTITGSWRIEGTSLVAMPQPLSRILIPFSPPEEYTLRAVVERVAGGDSVGLGLVVGGSQCRVILDAAASTMSGLDLVDGRRFNENATSLPGYFLPTGQRVTIVCHVRRNGVQVLRNGQPLLGFSGDPQRLSNSPNAAVPDPTRLFLTCHSTTLAFRALEAGPLDASASFPAETPLPTGIAARSPPSMSAAAAATSSTAPSPLTARTDLLKRIDPQRDAVVGNWTVDDGALMSPVADGARLQIPFEPPEEYVLALTIERRTGRDALAVGLVVGGSQSVISFDNFNGTRCGLELIDGKRLDVNESCVMARAFEGSVPHALVCVVHKGGVRAVLDGTDWINWSGDPKRLSMFSSWQVPDARRLMLGAWNSSFRISRFEIAPIEDAAAIIASARPAGASAAAMLDKLPVPSAEVLEQARQPLNTLVGDDLSKPRKAEDAGLVATLLLKHAADSGLEPPVRYLLLSEAARLAVQGGRLVPAFDAIAELTRRFDVDAVELEKRSLAEAARLARSPQVRQVMVEDALRLLDRALARGQYELANELHDAALATVQKITNPALLKDVRARTAEVKELRRQWDLAQSAIEKLTSDPADAAAHLALGRFKCFIVAQWEEGLPHLSEGSDAALREAARADLENPAEADTRLKLGDAWWELAEKAAAPARYALMERAALWYQRVPQVDWGPAESRIAPRLEKLADTRRTASAALVKRHPLDARYWRGHWYQAFPEKLTWEEARTRCEQMGGYLACISSAEENQTILQLAQPLVPSDGSALFGLWIGLSDAAAEGDFGWVDGSPLTYTDWKPGEPNNSTGGEDRVALTRLASSGNRLRWNDFNESIRWGFVCEWER